MANARLVLRLLVASYGRSTTYRFVSSMDWLSRCCPFLDLSRGQANARQAQPSPKRRRNELTKV